MGISIMFQNIKITKTCHISLENKSFVRIVDFKAQISGHMLKFDRGTRL